MNGAFSLVRAGICCCFALALAVGCASSSEMKPANPQESFPTPDAAVLALVDALRQYDRPRLKQILGPDGDAILASGDPVADRADASKFLALYVDYHMISQGDDSGNYTLVVGKDSWPFPVPIVKSGRKFIFDTETGREEVLNRRIGRNELAAQQVCLAIVDAQRDYVAMRPTAGDLPVYAQKLVSDAGTKNGLYWPTTADEAPSPLGPLIASAAAEGYGQPQNDAAKAPAAATTRPSRTAYHGYHYRLLTAQGINARGGPFEYLINGRLIGGFGVVAYPAQYGNSGVMTFITNHEGVVYQSDLGPQTDLIAQKMSVFDPGPTWTKAGDASQIAHGE
jgi:hypothetical protein